MTGNSAVAFSLWTRQVALAVMLVLCLASWVRAQDSDDPRKQTFTRAEVAEIIGHYDDLVSHLDAVREHQEEVIENQKATISTFTRQLELLEESNERWKTLAGAGKKKGFWSKAWSWAELASTAATLCVAAKVC